MLIPTSIQTFDSTGALKDSATEVRSGHGFDQGMGSIRAWVRSGHGFDQGMVLNQALVLYQGMPSGMPRNTIHGGLSGWAQFSAAKADCFAAVGGIAESDVLIRNRLFNKQ